MKILILGSTGLLGSYLSKSFSNFNYELILHGHSQKANICFDCCDLSQMISAIKEIKPNVVINLIGNTSIDKCEQNIKSAYDLNVKVVENIVSAILKVDSSTKLVHLSTDHIYDDINPSSEKDIIIRNSYALSKYAGEMAITGINALILRTNFFGKSLVFNRKSLTDWAVEKLSLDQQILAYDDILFNPLSMATLCELIIDSINNNMSGTFNVGSHGGMSKADFLIYFANLLNFNKKLILPQSYSLANKSKIERPKNMIMDVAKFENNAKTILPNLKNEIDKSVMEYKNEI